MSTKPKKPWIMPIKPSSPEELLSYLSNVRKDMGQSTFTKWIEEAHAPKEIEGRLMKKFVLGGYKSYSVARVVKELDLIKIRKK